jgi:purine-binding chemotaxis protein CheW
MPEPIAHAGRDSGEALQLVTFVLGGERYGVDIHVVREIIRPMECTRLPNAAAGQEGVVNLRGRVVPVVDLRTRMSIGRREHDADTRIVVAELSGTVVGFVVDAVAKVLSVPSSIIEPPPPVTREGEKSAVRGVGRLAEGLLILLDLETMLPAAGLIARA